MSAHQKTKNLLASYGIRPRKSLGQNFLTDTNFANAIAREARLDEHTLVLEIGPGTGLLTRALLEQSPRARILAVEMDGKLVLLLRETFVDAIESGRLVLIEGDALQGKHGLNPEWVDVFKGMIREQAGAQRLLCANLPYNAATPLMANMALSCFEGEPLCQRMLVTIQLELAERLFGKPGSKAYGPLAAFLQLRATGGILRRVGPEAFWPRPRVSSAVLNLAFLPWERVPFGPDEASAVLVFFQKLFQSRRKVIRSVLGLDVGDDEVLEKTRAEALAPSDLLMLYRTYGS